MPQNTFKHLYNVMIEVYELDLLWSRPKIMDSVELHNDTVNKVASICPCDLWFPNENQSRPVMAFGSTILGNPRGLLVFPLLAFR